MLLPRQMALRGAIRTDCGAGAIPNEAHLFVQGG